MQIDSDNYSWIEKLKQIDSKIKVTVDEKVDRQTKIYEQNIQIDRQDYQVVDRLK